VRYLTARGIIFPYQTMRIFIWTGILRLIFGQKSILSTMRIMVFLVTEQTLVIMRFFIIKVFIQEVIIIGSLLLSLLERPL